MRERGPGRLDRAAKGGSAWRGEKPAAGVQADEGPQRFGDAQPLARPPGRGGENGEGVAQQVAGAGQLVERVGVEPDEFLRAALPEPGEMTAVAGAAQPPADGGRPSAAAICRCPMPAALRASAVPITSVASARRGCSAAGSRTWVAPHPPQRTRRGRASIATAPRPRMRRRRPYPHRARVPPHPLRGQCILASARASSADSAVRTMIIGRYSGHEAPTWSITSSPGKGPNRVGAKRFGIGSAPADRSAGHRHRDDRPDTCQPSVPRRTLLVFTMTPDTTRPDCPSSPTVTRRTPYRVPLNTVRIAGRASSASNYGGPKHPQWYYNLKAHTECELMRREISGG